MDAQSLVTHSDAVIFHRNGVFLAGRLCGSVPSVRLAVPDLVLLSLFGEPAEPVGAVRELLSGPLRAYLPGLPPARAVLDRVGQLARGRVLVPGRGRGKGRKPMSLAAVEAVPLPDADAVLRLPSNFLLRPVAGGFEAWSATRGEAQVLDPGLVVLLAAFGPGRRVAEVVAGAAGVGDEARRRRGVGWLFQQGLLVRGGAAAAARPAAERNGQAPEAATESGSTWEDMAPDGRIPVYFVPHMENHYPLALGMIYSALESHDGGALLDRFQLVPITFLPPKDFIEGPYRKFGPGVWLFSNYMWSVTQNLKVSAAIKQHDRRNLTVHGGPSTPAYQGACEAFMARHGSVDVAVHGEGELTAVELFGQLYRNDAGGVGFDPDQLSRVAGLTFRDPQQDTGLVRSPPRVRMRNVDAIPSPYEAGVFDAYRGKVDAAIVETNRGCPFACTFCDWGSATNGKVAKFDLDRVRAEIDWVGRNRVRVLWIADANFGMLRRDLEIAEWIVDVRKRYGFPQEVVVNYTKNATRKLADIIRVFSAGHIVSQGIISIQTTDEQTLGVIDRQNIKTDKYDELIQVFDDAGLPLSTDLMIGLPGITPEAFDRDLQRYIDVDVQVKAYPTQLLPNSPMADPEYIRRYEIEVDDNDFLVSCYSYTREELRRMKAIYEVYVATEGYGALRYVMRYLQWEHGIPAVRVMHDLLDAVKLEPGRFAAIAWVVKFFNTEKCMPGGWRRFYEEVAGLVSERYGVRRDPAFDVVLKVNEAAMPDETRDYPMTIVLEHDFVAWFTEHNVRVGRPDKVRPLAAYPPGEFTVDDPDGMASINFDYQQYDSHQYFWELRSPVARAQSAADLKDRPSLTSGAGGARAVS